MSPDVIAAGVFGITGAVVGAVVGLFGERLVRSRGKVGCQLVRRVDRWRVGPDGKELAPEEVGRLADFDRAEAQVECDVQFFNEKEVDVGLSRLAVVFIAEDGEEARLEPTDSRYGETVNAVSRRWSEAKVAGVIRGASSRLVRDYHTVEVRGEFPDHSLYKDTVTRRITASVRIGV